MLLTGVADETAANGVAALALVEAVGRANDEARGLGVTDTDAPADAQYSQEQDSAAVVAFDPKS